MHQLQLRLQPTLPQPVCRSLRKSWCVLASHHLPHGYSERLEQLDWVAGWIVDKNLFASVSGHDRIAESRSLTFQFLDRGFQILHHNLDSVPTTWSRNLFICHRLSSTTSTGPIQQQL